MATYPSSTFRLLSPRLYISHVLAPQHSQLIVDLYNSDLFLKHNGKTGIDNPEKAQKFIEGRIASTFQKYGHGQYLISLRSAQDTAGEVSLVAGREGDLRPGEVPIGLVTLMRGEQYSVPDIGFALLPEYVGKGYATEAGKRLIEYATAPEDEPGAAAAADGRPRDGRGLGLAGVFGFTDRHNENSKRVCLRLGLEYRGVYALEAFGGDESAVFALPGMGDVSGYGIKGERLDE